MRFSTVIAVLALAFLAFLANNHSTQAFPTLLKDETKEDKTKYRAEVIAYIKNYYSNAERLVWNPFKSKSDSGNASSENVTSENVTSKNVTSKIASSRNGTKINSRPEMKFRIG